ncbi:hypothetical protein FB567DRAFT_168054 [Paraphoma chrysanthemicola]|uniref:HECT-type E3 ubiquitin transferase n=1 Tax=Paraphoma chrysanthemicola TaxID=798071 RepID=A0A8K0RDZ5_9PLEO|nr:hypothetical protein FB567DRAFT_168054 [Paraphoma chrysanthemicola]
MGAPPGPRSNEHGHDHDHDHDHDHHVEDADDARRVLECVQAERKLQSQHLVRHFLSQILHGCKSAYCTTSTCLSAQKRSPPRPVRPPTQLTARALAHYLAGQPNAHLAICPHELKVEPASLELDGASRSQPHNVEALSKRRQPRKDAKSLSQNLHDSVAMIHSYSQQLPSSASVLTSLRSTGLASHAKRPPAPAPSQTNRHPRTPPPSAQRLSSGLQIHKIPYHPSQPKAAAHNDAETRPTLTITKTGTKSFTLGGTDVVCAHTPRLHSSHGHSKKVLPPRSRPDLVLPVLSSLNCDTLEQLKDGAYHRFKCHGPDAPDFPVDFDPKRHLQRPSAFVNRSLFNCLSRPDTLLASFQDRSPAFADSPLPHLDSARLVHAFRDWNQRNGPLIFDSLCLALEALCVPPPELSNERNARPTIPRKSVPKDRNTECLSSTETTTVESYRYLSDNEAAHIIVICLHALTSSVSVGWPHTWAQLRKLRAWGIIVPNIASDADDFMHPYMNIIDELEYDPAVRLADSLLRAIGMRTCFEHIQVAMSKVLEYNEKRLDRPSTSFIDIVFRHLTVVERVALDSRRRLTPSSSAKASDDPGWTVTATFVEWLKTIIIKKWDSKADINKWSAVGTAVLLLDKLGSSYRPLNLREQMLKVPFFNEHLDAVDEPLRFLSIEKRPNTLHILHHPRLFPLKYLIRYFRTLNFSTMMAQYDQTTRVRQMQRSLDMFLRDSHRWLIKSHMHVTLSDYLVLDISRHHPLQDALDQLWGLEKRLLLKPLKVNMGKHEGEVGADHGGVTYEFFRVVLSEAFHPDHGMFILHPQSHMTWFQPGTLEPDWKFEMIGIIFSLAVYNGITLPVTFPLALYRFLLPLTAPLRSDEDNEDSVESIKDGWPDLANGFEHLLTWVDGDVQDVFMRDYAFSYDVFGHRVDHNMHESCTCLKTAAHDFQDVQSEDARSAQAKCNKTVTSENRVHFVRDYIRHLTYLSVSSQIRAFRKGFLACLQPKSLHFFSPETLRSLVEGVQDISIANLRQCVRYEDGYSSTHSTIRFFWRTVECYAQENRRRLLEFVTASDRVPVTGYESITFHIVRTGNVEMLPTSSTCFGKLYLPDYPDEATLQTKLDLAIQNSKGFGVV